MTSAVPVAAPPAESAHAGPTRGPSRQLSDGYELEDVLDRAPKMHERALATISGADCRIG